MKYKIGWQKYEDVVEQNLSSPIMDMIANSISSLASKQEEYEEYEEEENQSTETSMIPISPHLMDEISMLSNFDCWMAHTNFDITNNVREELDQIEGVELLKVCSRYRFFIGVGRMFNFKEVRKRIEDKLTK
jgi:hypothetical protein